MDNKKRLLELADAILAAYRVGDTWLMADLIAEYNALKES